MPTLKKSETEKEQEKEQGKALWWARACLLSLNFFAETNRMEPLVAVYLIEVQDWDVVWVGYVSVVMNIIMIVSQTPAGDLMDKTKHKKLIVAGSLLVASVTTAAVAWTSKLYAIILIKAAEGVAASMFLPGLMALLLAVVPAEDAPRTVSLTEVSNKLGSVLFTIGTGVAAYYLYPDVRGIFYLLGAGGLAAAASVMAIPGGVVDDNRARGGAVREDGDAGVGPTADRTEAGGSSPSEEEAVAEGPVEGTKAAASEDSEEEVEYWGYRQILADRKIAMFALITFLYHLSNAAVLPLLAQLIAHEDERTGLVFTSVVMCVTFFVQAPASYVVGLTYKKFGYKRLLLAAHVILPLRCATCALLAIYYPNKYALAATQIYEGIGAGIYDTVLPLLVGSLVKGSGRFGVAFGFVITMWRLGHGFSLLVGEAMLKAGGERYEVPFLAFGAGGVLAFLLFAFGVSVPPTEEEAASGPRPVVQRKGSSILLVMRDDEDDVDSGVEGRQGSRRVVKQRSTLSVAKRVDSKSMERSASSMTLVY